MTTLFAPTALLADGWADNVLIECDKDGWIVGIDSFKPPSAAEGAEVVQGPLLPGMASVHSHAFQRAMAGLIERGAGRKENFWSWRDTMYRFLSQIDADDLEALTAQTYVEMLKAGYTTVGEFHYVHHQPDGTPYPERAALSHQIIQAALETGIAITHMPVLYAYGGFGETPPETGQKRFLNSVDQAVRIVEEVYAAHRAAPQVTIGFGHHSLRAVSPEMLRAGTAAVRRLLPNCPIHIHAAEQAGEVEDCLAWSQKRPVEWLVDNAGLDENWTLIHCIHVTGDELRGLAKTGALVALCPTTEANLGDGIFPLMRFLELGGRFAIGSDSHISVSLVEELRWLEYVQRLIHRKRTLITRDDNPSVGAVLFEQAAQGGGQSLGRKTGRIEIGYRADFIVLDPHLPCLQEKLRDHILDAAIFATSENPVKDVMAGGRWVVRDRRHRREEQVFEKFRRSLKKMK